MRRLWVTVALVACSETGGQPGASSEAGADGAPLDAVALDGPVTDAPAEAIAPSGQPMPIGDVAGWRQVFADDFTTDVPLGSFPAAVSSKWDAYPDGWKDTSKNGTYQASKVISVSDGLMRLHLHTENGVHMVAAPEPKIPGGKPGLLYGRYVARFKSDAVPGYKTAWLLWPDSNTWPQDGEIDFPEGNLTSTISAFMHRQNGANGGDQDAYATPATYTSWHTADLQWTSTACTFALDGVTIGTSTQRIPSTLMHWVLQTETQLSGGAPSDAAAGDVVVDWVVVYVPS